MAHIPPSAAIFSPSVARLASSAAKDWNYVDSWLSSKFPGRSPPPFERTPETLKALVTLAALNESLDEGRDLVASAESRALQTLGNGAARMTVDGSSVVSLESVAESIVAAIEDNLSREGCSAFESLASASLELGMPYPDPADVGRKAMELQARLFQLEQDIERMGFLQARVQEQTSKSRDLLEELDSATCRPAASLAKLNLELQRKVKAGAARLQDTKERADGSDAVPESTVQKLKEEETVYLELLAYRKVIDKQIRSFQGLPPDKDLARQQLDALRTELYSAKQRRDIVFEGLVERATPKKPR